MRLVMLAMCLVGAMLAQTLRAETVMSEVTGNWAGADGGGFYFRAVLSQVEDRARLQIWNGLDAVPDRSDAPAFDNDQIALAAFATAQRLEVIQTDTGSMLGLTIAFADETAEGQEALMISYVDNQFTLMGFGHESTVEGADKAYTCALDLWNGTAVVNGVAGALPPMDFEAKNALTWTFGAAFAREYCPALE